MGSQQERQPEPGRGSAPATSAQRPVPLWRPAGAAGPGRLGEVQMVTDSRRPRAVTVAFWFGVLDVVVAGGLLAAECLMSDDLVLRAMGNAEFLLTEADVREVYYGIRSGVVVLAAFAALVWLALLLAMRRGRPWARAALTAIGFGWAVYSLLSLVGRHPDGMVFPVLEAAQVLVLAATLVAMHVRSARDHFVL